MGIFQAIADWHNRRMDRKVARIEANLEEVQQLGRLAEPLDMPFDSIYWQINRLEGTIFTFAARFGGARVCENFDLEPFYTGEPLIAPWLLGAPHVALNSHKVQEAIEEIKRDFMFPLLQAEYRRLKLSPSDS